MLDTLFSGNATWFAVPALIGTGVFVVRLLLMLLGGDSDMDVDVGDAHADLGGHDLDGTDSDQSFTILSVQGLSAFLMGFGWAGLGALLGAGWAVPTSLGVGLVGGLGLSWLLVLLLRAVYDLQSSGTVRIQSAVGASGEVYTTVPGHAQGRGQIRVVVDNRQRIYDAVTTGDELPTRSRVRVLAVNDDRTLTVSAG